MTRAAQRLQAANLGESEALTEPALNGRALRLALCPAVPGF
jgi:hypothetical protein